MTYTVGRILRIWNTSKCIQSPWTSFRDICGLWKGNPWPSAVLVILPTHTACMYNEGVACGDVFCCVSSEEREELGTERLACIRATANFKVKYPPRCCRENVSPDSVGLFYLCWPIQGGQGWLRSDSSYRTEQEINKQSGLMDWWIIYRLRFHSHYINFGPWYHLFVSVRMLGVGWYTFNV